MMRNKYSASLASTILFGDSLQMKLSLATVANHFITLVSKAFAILDGQKVAEISTEQIRKLQSNPDDKFVLVDVRSADETCVSVIPKAITQGEFEASFDIYRDHVVIAYCTIGGRSLAYARQLLKRGVDSRNFKAGIIGWCESGLPLESPQGNDTKRVHTYSAMFHVPAEYEQVTRDEAAE